jgi:hypothetical protein
MCTVEVYGELVPTSASPYMLGMCRKPKGVHTEVHDNVGPTLDVRRVTVNDVIEILGCSK